MGCIDRYMADGTLPPGGSDTATIPVFNLLRMEIDKALQRSRRARQRAAERVADAARKHREPAAVAAVSAPQQPNRMLTPMMPRTKNRSRSDRATAANAAFTSRRCAVRQTGCAAVRPDSKHPYGAPRSLSPAMMIFRARLKTTSCLRYSRIFANFADAFCGSEKLLRSAVCNVI